MTEAETLARVEQTRQRLTRVTTVVLTAFGVAIIVGLTVLTALSLNVFDRVKEQTSPRTQARQASEVSALLTTVSCNTRSDFVIVLHDIAPTVSIHVPARDGCPAYNAGP